MSKTISPLIFLTLSDFEVPDIEEESTSKIKGAKLLPERFDIDIGQPQELIVTIELAKPEEPLEAIILVIPTKVHVKQSKKTKKPGLF